MAAPTSANTADGADEIEVAELNPATAGAKPDLYMTIRYDAANGGPGAHRRSSTSSDEGITWAPMQDVQVPDPGCKGGLVQDKAGSNLVIATAASCSGRVNQTIFLSKENGAPGSWVYRQFVAPKSGYSTLAMTDEGMIANLFEDGGCAFTLALVDPDAMIANGPVSLHSASTSSSLCDSDPRGGFDRSPLCVQTTEWCHPVRRRALPHRAPTATARRNKHFRWVLRGPSATAVSSHPLPATARFSTTVLV